MKTIYKEFVVCKDGVLDEVEFHKGDVLQLLPIEFFDETEPEYREQLVEAGIHPDQVIDVCFYTPKEFRKAVVGEVFNFKYERPFNVFELPYLFNTLKIAPRNVTIDINE